MLFRGSRAPEMGDFPTFYGIFMKFHENPQFLVKFIKKHGIAWKSANFHDFLDFRRSGSAKALEFACIIRHFLGSAAGVADLEIIVKYRKNRFSWKFMKISEFYKIPWNSVNFHDNCGFAPLPAPRSPKQYELLLYFAGSGDQDWWNFMNFHHFS